MMFSVGEKFFFEVKCANKVDTRCLEDKELLCLEGLVANLEVLEAAAETSMEGEFDNIKLEDGHYTLTNARYKTRVRASEQVCC